MRPLEVLDRITDPEARERAAQWHEALVWIESHSLGRGSEALTATRRAQVIAARALRGDPFKDPRGSDD